jgi:hypothetical protein
LHQELSHVTAPFRHDARFAIALADSTRIICGHRAIRMAVDRTTFDLSAKSFDTMQAMAAGPG